MRLDAKRAKIYLLTAGGDRLGGWILDRTIYLAPKLSASVGTRISAVTTVHELTARCSVRSCTPATLQCPRPRPAVDFVIVRACFLYQSFVASNVRVLAVWATVLTVGRVGHAEPAQGLDYQAPPACPDRASFVAAVAKRGGDFTATAQSFYVRIRASEQGFGGSLSVRSADVTSGAREVKGTSCEEVVEALAVVTAIALNEKTTVASPTEPASVAPVGAPSVADAGPAPQPPRVVRPPPLHAVTTLGRKNIAVQAGNVRLDYRFEIAGFGGAVLGLIPGEVMPRIDVTAARANFVTLPNGETHLLGTIARFRWSLLLNQSFLKGDTALELGGQQLGVGLCSSPYYHEDGLVLLGCAELAVGLMQLKIREPGLAERSQTTGFGQFGLNAEASYHFGRHFLLAAKLGIDAPVTRLEVDRADGSQIFQSSVVMGSGMLGLGGSF